MEIALIILKDKQAFSKGEGPMRLIGKPLDVARRLKERGFRLLHIVDSDALNGKPANLDVYDGLTYFINVQVECAPRPEFVHKLLSLKCRVVLPPSDLPGAMDVRLVKEKRLLVAKIPPGYGGSAEGFHDVILEDADDGSVRRFSALGKRVMIYKKDEGKVEEAVWGVIAPSS